MIGLWLVDKPLVLASGSAARSALLQSAAVPLEVAPAAIDERRIEEPLRQRGAPPHEIALHLAREKALAVSHGKPGRLVLGADQTLDLAGRMLTKPADLEEARWHLHDLSGRTHVLHSAWALARDGVLIAENAAEAHLTMRDLSPAFLDRYLALEGETLLSSVGSYRLEGLGVHLFRSIEGDQSTILGLPLLTLLPALRHHGYLMG